MTVWYRNIFIVRKFYHNSVSIHNTTISPLNYNFKSEVELGDQIIEIISQARGAKTNSAVSLKTPIKKLNIDVSDNLRKAIEGSIKDFKATLFIEKLEMNNIKDGFNVNEIELNLEENNN